MLISCWNHWGILGGIVFVVDPSANWLPLLLPLLLLIFNEVTVGASQELSLLLLDKTDDTEGLTVNAIVTFKMMNRRVKQRVAKKLDDIVVMAETTD
jgi:hypothetical protein